MTESVLDVKAHLQELYLGRYGIHALGANPALSTIRIFYSPQKGVDVQRITEEIAAAARPYKVVMVSEQPPVLR